MISTYGVITRGSKSIESKSNVRIQHKKQPSSRPWKIVFGLEDPDRGSGAQHVRIPKGGGGHKRGGQESNRDEEDHLLDLEPTLKRIMKQLSNIKRKFAAGKRSGDAVGGKQQQATQIQQNGQQQQQPPQHRRKVKKPLSKKPLSTDTQVRNKLNVNERPVRKKKKTKKYESYERNGKSPDPEVKQETNLLLALGLTPVKKDVEDVEKLNRMHIMEEDNAKDKGDAAELPQTQPDLPKKSSTSGKAPETAISLDSTESESKSSTDQAPSQVNGIASDTGKGETVGRKNSSEKIDLRKDDGGITSIRIPSTCTSTSIEIKKEVDGRGESFEADDREREKEKNSEPHDLTVTCTQSFEKQSKTSQNEKHYPNSKVISISVEQCQTNSNSVNCATDDGVDKLKKPKPIASRKRSNKSTDSDESYKANYKRPKFLDVDGGEERERTVSEYVERASGSSLEELQMNTEKLQQEIHSLSALARAKELEWNDIIRLKKVKEEMYLRLVRRKQVMLLSMGGSGRLSDSVTWDFASDNRMTEFVTNDEVTYNRVAPSVSPKPPRLPSNLTITKSQSSPSQNLQRFLMQPHGASDSKPNTSLMMVPIVSSTPISISSTSSYLPHLGTPLKIPVPDREKLKVVNNRNAPIPILPKPNQNVNHAVNNHSPPIGRQGPIVDVKSIIADYRQNHPEQVPRRGRRPKGQPSQNFAETMVSSGRGGVLSMASLALGSGAQVRTVSSNSDGMPGSSGQSHDTSRPSSADSNRSTSNAAAEVGGGPGVSFKDVLVQFAKMSQHQQTGDRRNSTPPTKSQSSKAPPYPEVTLHPVLPAGSQSPPNPSSSLLHGILTKNNGGSGSSRGDNQHTSRSTTFSPTLARLLTTPDRSSMSTTITTALRGSQTSTTASRVSSGAVSIADLLSTSKNRNELTITPIISNLQPAKMKEDVGAVSDDDPDDTADRLVIDESEEQEARNGDADEEMDGETVPECQGCHLKSAQFVCAGCGNQWYCSRNCQVTAWDEHSEVCSG